MFVLKTIQSLVFGSQPEDPIETSQPLIDINALSAKYESEKISSNGLDPNVEPEDKEKENENLCEERVGKVMYVNEQQVLIDEGLEFDTTDFPNLNLVEGDRVAYIAYRKEVHHEWRIQKILYVVEREWEGQVSKAETEETDEHPQHSEEEFAAPQSEAVPKDVLQRTRVCQVMEKKGRKLILKPGDLICDLDRVKCKFVPVAGDWVELEAATVVDEKAYDLEGDVLDVQEIRPLRSRIHVGVVTRWNMKEGVINKDTYFNKDSCEPGYCPVVGQKIIVEAIESQQGYLTWRALTAVSYGAETHSREKKYDYKKGMKLSQELGILLQNKKGIVISEVLNFGLLNLGEKKDIVAEIKNKGSATEVLYHCRSRSKCPESQFRCTYPNGNQNVVISPGQTVECHFSCEGRFLGKVSELFVFSFQGFKIGRHVEAEVQHPAQSQLLPLKGYHGDKYVLPQSYNQIKGNIISGVRPLKPAAFVPVRIPDYPVPDKFFGAITGRVKMNRYDGVLQKLKEIEPTLASDVRMPTYAKRFHALLYVEEVYHTLSMQQYDMKRIQFTVAGPCGEYLALDIPGLSERRPSLLIGNRAMAVNSDEIDNQNSQKFEGFVHKVFPSQVWLKFHAMFHATCKDKEYDISFCFGRTPMRRCHAAVDLAVKHLGDKILFPAIIKFQPPQLHLEEDCNELSPCKKESNIEKHVTVDALLESWQNNSNFKNKSLMHYLNYIAKEKQQSALSSETSEFNFNLAEEIPELAKRKIKWLNPYLNSYQKDAIRNVLKGQARPLPYVIFGPPGTGKTMTVVEAILQTLILLPHTRILAATPSNSSADLLAERLLDSGVLKPGDLVRLVAFNYLEEGRVPEKLLPYSTIADIKMFRGDLISTTPLEAPRKLSTNAEVLGRHRITVSTCISLGQLYSLGFTRNHFTHVFVDEAGQATEPEVMIPTAFLNSESGQIVLAGDPLQLGPVVLSTYAEGLGLADSFLTRLMQCSPYQRDEQGFPDTGGYNPLVVTQLRMNYRCVPELLNIANTLFYNSSIKAYVSQTKGPEAELLAHLAPSLPERSPEDGGPPPIIFHGIRGQNFQDEDSPSWFNPQEIVEALNYANILYDNGLIPDDIGIITPYQKQVKKLRIFFEEFGVPCPKIGSVEEFQGQERKVIILSTVRSSLSAAKIDIRYSLGFVASPRRLNVSLTRARALLIILGNPHLLATDPLWRSVLKYCVGHKAYRGCDLPVAEDLWNLRDDK